MGQPDRDINVSAINMTEAGLVDAPERSTLRVCLLGSTGTIGQATLRVLVNRGHNVVCFVRPGAGAGGSLLSAGKKALFDGATLRFVDVLKPTGPTATRRSANYAPGPP